MIVLAVEDELLGTLGEKILNQARPDLQVANTYLCSGSGKLRSRLAAFNNACQAMPHLVLTDLDKEVCAPEMIAKWTQGLHINQGLYLRIAVREAEAWVLADRIAFAGFLNIAVNRVHPYPEQLDDPKAELIRLAMSSPRAALRRALTPIGKAKQGPEHNDVLIAFLNEKWDFGRAAANAPSLARAGASLARV